MPASDLTADVSFRWLLTASHCVLNAAETGFVSASSSQKIHYGCAVQVNLQHSADVQIVRDARY
eukprot:2456384-Rhodomonas_salina.1